ncbi:hypothetical protein [Chitinophaga rhizophila]|uniref:Uncharacterized protein n=1 Tax=Chitinophaga rhizophila TaxID=2866212 RepID=A0ABS7G8Y2_9BACT|nr:hypothetical protein [Chitinophaga rhizophila]MBW8683585.1 hypothetical protein [Chitinophaga rhizophila]
MAEDAKQEKEILAELKKDFPLTKESIKEVDFKHFPSFHRSNNFRITYAWRFTDFSPRAYFAKYRNSYKVNTAAQQTDQHELPATATHKFAGIYIKFDYVMPDFIIRANTQGDKFLNLYFPNVVKVKSIPAFNHKYILESLDAATIEQVIGQDIFAMLMNEQDLNIEVKDNKCLIFGLTPFSYEYCKTLILLAQELIKRNLESNIPVEEPTNTSNLLF